LKSLEGVRNKKNSWEMIAEKIGLRYWPPYRSGWECRDFSIDVLTNESPTITLQTKAFIRVRDMIVEAEFKKR
jgi:hypothetical protein